MNLRFGLLWSFRNPDFNRVPWADLYRSHLDLIVDSEAMGYDNAWLTEHHFVDDGYSPSLLPIAAGIATRTTRIRIGTFLVLLPLHNPVRLAEDTATVDLMSNGRFDLGVGLGYRLKEFSDQGIAHTERGARLREGIEIVQRLLSDEEVTIDGKFSSLNKIRIVPPALQQPHPPIWLGAGFDIHCGGVDLIFPHHENEIAQSEAATNKPFVHHWVHSEFLLVESDKMSKSEGNQYTLQDLMERGCDPRAIRYLLQSVHYRKQLNFTFAGVEQARSALRRIHDFLLRVGEVPDDRPENPDLSQRAAQTRSDFLAGLDEDLNTSIALGVLFELIKDTNILLERQEVGSVNRDQILALFADANQVFAVFETEESQTEDQEISELIQEREEARRQRDFGRADEIRDLLTSRGFVLEDTKAGTRWKRAV